MGREVRRVPPDFNHPINEVWPGFCPPDGLNDDELDAWEETDPPEGDGWQLWETVSEGSPISPPFATSGELVAWLCTGAYKWGGPLDRADAEALVNEGWMPSMVFRGPTTVVAPGGQGLASFLEGGAR
jgi:hypothetical protein